MIDGTYDNSSTFCREEYRGGKLTGFLTASNIEQLGKRFKNLEHFGALPIITGRKCISCGAAEVNGEVPCGH